MGEAIAIRSENRIRVIVCLTEKPSCACHRLLGHWLTVAVFARHDDCLRLPWILSIMLMPASLVPAETVLSLGILTLCAMSAYGALLLITAKRYSLDMGATR